MKATTVDKLTTRALKCRSLGHAWDPVAAIVEARGRIRMEIKCLRCRSERTDIIIRSKGELEKRRYGYQNRYLVEDPKSYGTRGMLNARVRMALVERLVR